MRKVWLGLVGLMVFTGIGSAAAVEEYHIATCGTVTVEAPVCSEPASDMPPQIGQGYFAEAGGLYHYNQNSAGLSFLGSGHASPVILGGYMMGGSISSTFVFHLKVEGILPWYDLDFSSLGTTAYFDGREAFAYAFGSIGGNRLGCEMTRSEPCTNTETRVIRMNTGQPFDFVVSAGGGRGRFEMNFRLQLLPGTADFEEYPSLVLYDPATQTDPPGSDPTQTPEPATAVLMVAGLAGCTLMKRT